MIRRRRIGGLALVFLLACAGGAGENAARRVPEESWISLLRRANVAVPGRKNILRPPADANNERFAQLAAGRDDWLALRCDSRALSDEWMKRVATFKKLVAFSNTFVSPADLSARGMALLGQCPELRVIELCSARPLDDDALAAIAEGCPELAFLRVCDGGAPPLTDDGLTALAACPKLREVRLRGVTEITDQTPLSFLHAGLDLELLEIPAGRIRFTDAGFAALAAGARLRSVDFRVAKEIGDGALAGFGVHNKNLRRFVLRGAEEFTADGLAKLALAPNLSSLELPDARRLNDDALAVLGRHAKNLVVLNLPRAREIGDGGLKALAEGCPKLRVLRLPAAANVGDEGLLALAASCPELRQIEVNASTRPTDAALDALAGLGHLNSLNLARAKGVTEEGRRRFTAARPRTRLRTVSFEGAGILPAPEAIDQDVF